MSQSDTPSGGRSGVKTLAIRLEPDLHAQLSVIAQLRGSTITDEIRQAIEQHIERSRSDASLTAKADSVLDDIERDAEARRGAIASLFGESGAPSTATPTTGGRTSKGRSSGPTP